MQLILLGGFYFSLCIVTQEIIFVYHLIILV